MVCACIPTRFVIAVMICLASIITYIVRGNMSMTILAMAKPIYNSTKELPDYGPRYLWSAQDQSLVVGSFYCGQVVIILFAGIVAEHYGPRMIVGFGIIFGAILLSLAPTAANILWLLIAANFFVGVSIGILSPAMQALISNWAPPEEKGKFLATIMSNGFGIVINWSMSGFIIAHFGWKYAFYAVVVILGIFGIAWFWIVYDSPNHHPSITAEEKEFILSRMTTTTKSKPWPPFGSILLSVPMWALLFFHFGNVYASYLFLTNVPKYLSDVHQFNISTTGVFSIIPYLIRFPSAVAFGFLGDFVFKRKIMSATAIRKSFSLFSHFIPACFLIGLAFVGNRPYVSVALISLALGFGGAATVTSFQNPHDLSPNFAATIFAFIHTAGSTPGFIAPLIVAHFTKERSSQEEWRYIFLIGAGIYVGTAIIFILFGSGKVQKWNEIKKNDGSTETTEFIGHQ